MITVQHHWNAAFEGQARAQVEALLPDFLRASRWFGGKAQTIRSTRFADILRAETGDGAMVLGLIDVSYREGGAELYTLPITAAFDTEADRIRHDHPQSVIGALTVTQHRKRLPGILYDALWNEACAYALLTSMRRRAPFQGSSGTLAGSATGLFDEADMGACAASSSVLTGEQSNTSVKFSDCAIMKLYRRVEPGMNPELDIGRALTARRFTHSPALLGALQYVQGGAEPVTLALTQTFVANQGNAWDYTLTQLSRDIDRIIPLNSSTSDLLFDYRDSANLLGQRTGELHMALGQPSDTAALTPEACSESYLQTRVEAMQQAATQALALLRRRLPSLSEADRTVAQTVLGQESVLLDRFETLASQPLSALRIRCHGDYHLGQVLYTGCDFVIIDFEGEPAKPLAERRAKCHPMVDLAGMVRSFHYAAHAALRTVHSRYPNLPSQPGLLPWVEQWYRTARAAFLRGYRTTAGQAAFSPQSQAEFNLLLDIHMLDKAFYELTYELNNRPDWVWLPLASLLQFVEPSQAIEDEDTVGKRPVPRSAGQASNEVNQ